MRGTPTYDLREIQRLIAAGPENCLVTHAARVGAAAIGCLEQDVLNAVLTVCPKHFYKSMESEQLVGYWQDVYHLPWSSTLVYLKVQIYAGRAVIIQFKRK